MVEVVGQATRVGVTRILAVGTDLQSSHECVQLASRFPEVFASVGIHPHDCTEFGASALTELRNLAARPKVVAIGEIGLDYERANVPRAQQLSAFTGQAALAAELGLPIVVHNRGADGDILAAISGVNREPSLFGRAGVLHCFTGSTDLAGAAHALGFFISFAGNLTYRRSVSLCSIASDVPLSWLLTETDCPFLAPEPKRGTTNAPENVVLVAAKIAAVRGASIDEVARETSANAATLFGWA